MFPGLAHSDADIDAVVDAAASRRPPWLGRRRRLTPRPATRRPARTGSASPTDGTERRRRPPPPTRPATGGPAGADRAPAADGQGRDGAGHRGGPAGSRPRRSWPSLVVVAVVVRRLVCGSGRARTCGSTRRSRSTSPGCRCRTSTAALRRDGAPPLYYVPPPLLDRRLRHLRRRRALAVGRARLRHAALRLGGGPAPRRPRRWRRRARSCSWPPRPSPCATRPRTACTRWSILLVGHGRGGPAAGARAAAAGQPGRRRRLRRRACSTATTGPSTWSA